MTILQIKQLLSLADVVAHYGLKPSRSNALRCPFHEGKPGGKAKNTLQLYPDKNTAYCFNTKCPTHGHSMDVVDFVLHKEKIDKHSAILYCKELIYASCKAERPAAAPAAAPAATPMKTTEQKAEETAEETTEANLPAAGIETELIDGQQVDTTTGEILPPSTIPITPMKTTEKTTDKNLSALGTATAPPPLSKHHPHPPAPVLQRNEYGQLCLLHEQLQLHLIVAPEVKHLGNMRISLLLKKNPHRLPIEVIRQSSVDLYHYEGVQKFIKKVAEQLNLSLPYTTEVFAIFTELLETYRLEKHALLQHKNNPQDMPAVLPALSQAQQQQLAKILHSKNVVAAINELIGLAGIVGEESNRIFLFTILSAYKQPQPLSALIQGSSGSGKTALFAGVLQFFPERDVFNSTRITDGSLYNFGEYELMFKIIANEDIDGLGPAALFALRELVSKGFIISSTTAKDEGGNIKSIMVKVCGPVSFVGCTTQAALYEDNMGRVFTIAVDESIEQTKRIIGYQNKKSAGKIDRSAQAAAVLLLQHLVQKLQPVEVINQYAEYINLPDETHQLRRLNALFKIYIEQVTRLHQHSLTPAAGREGRGEAYHTTRQHIQLASDSFFECIVLKCDELNGEIRRFYEWLKGYVIRQSKAGKADKKAYHFTQREVRQAYNKSKASISNYFTYLTELEYLSSSGGSNRSVVYGIDYWDDHQALRKRLKTFIQAQIDVLPG